ncbi:MAG: glycosyltransferase, partial [Massilibacteroides sp.]|nr:glycosyltransferase [Massilibacteroides sp.]
MTLINFFFWFCFFIVFYTYIGYGFLLWLLVKLKEAFVPTPVMPVSNPEFPEVTLFITAYNESRVVEEKMKNSLSIDYPKEKLHILWVTDGSSDDTVEKLQCYMNIHLLHQPERRGKTAAMNRGMQSVNTPLTVFTDANTMINREAIREIARLMND